MSKEINYENIWKSIDTENTTCQYLPNDEIYSKDLNWDNILDTPFDFDYSSSSSSSSEYELSSSSSSSSSSSENDEEEFVRIETENNILKNKLKETNQEILDIKEQLEMKSLENERLKMEVTHHISQNDIMLNAHNKYKLEIDNTATFLLEEKNYSNKIVSLWQQYSQNLLNEIVRKEKVIEHKDEKVTRLVKIIRNKNKSLNKNYINLDNNLESKLMSNNHFIFLEKTVENICKKYMDDNINDSNYYKFEEFMNTIKGEYIQNISSWLINIKMDSFGKLLFVENFLNYAKFRFLKENMDDLYFFEYGWNMDFKEFATDYYNTLINW